MSLVNDLLIEAERRRAAPLRASAPRLDDLVPNRARASERPAWGRIGYSFAAIVGLALMAAIAHSGQNLRLVSELAPVPGAASLPPVAARLAEPTPLNISPTVPAIPAVPSIPDATTTSRPVRVESVSLERTSTSTRLRIVTDGRTAHRVEHAVDSTRLELILSGASLVEPTQALDLLGTPIRSLDLRAEEPDLRLTLELDPDVRSQSHWLELQSGAVLVLDLQAPVQREADASAKETEVVAGTAIETDEQSTEFQPAVDSYEIAAAPSKRADRVISPSLGDPAEMRIERSQRDQEREERAAARAAIAESLATARRARSEGRLKDADAGYAEVALLAPEDWAALIEWSDLLVLLERSSDALALIEGARTRAPRHQGLLIAEARLLEAKGDRARAIELLEQSGLALTEAPDVHALAAAYHQRAGHHEAAIERYEEILRRFPEESRGWMGLGISFEAVGRRHEARDVYRISLQVGELPGGTRRWVTARLAALGEED